MYVRISKVLFKRTCLGGSIFCIMYGYESIQEISRLREGNVSTENLFQNNSELLERSTRSSDFEHFYCFTTVESSYSPAVKTWDEFKCLTAVVALLEDLHMTYLICHVLILLLLCFLWLLRTEQRETGAPGPHTPATNMKLTKYYKFSEERRTYIKKDNTIIICSNHREFNEKKHCLDQLYLKRHLVWS